MRVKTLLSVLLLACSSGLVQGICYDQSPFWFTANPTAESLFDEDGNMISNKMRVRWTTMHNFKCVDYFQVEYYNALIPDLKMKTPKIARNKMYVDIDVEPCTSYVFKVWASEDYQGRRVDFKIPSNTVNHKNKYTPQFMSSVSVKELKIRQDMERKRKERSQLTVPPRTAPPVTAPPWPAPPRTAPPRTAPARTASPWTTRTAPPRTAPPWTTRTAPPRTTPPRSAPLLTAPPRTAPPGTALPGTAPPWTTQPGTIPLGLLSQSQEDEEAELELEPMMLRIQWRVNQIDYPACLDYFVLDYYDIIYNESMWAKTIRKPFPNLVKQDVHSNTVPCHPEFRYILRVFDLFGYETRTDWTPPSCMLTTPPPTTTKKTEAVGFGEAETLEAIVAENEQLGDKIEGIKEEYEKIGEEVFKAFFEDFLGSLVYVVAKRGVGGNETDVVGARR